MREHHQLPAPQQMTGGRGGRGRGQRSSRRVFCFVFGVICLVCVYGLYMPQAKDPEV